MADNNPELQNIFENVERDPAGNRQELGRILISTVDTLQAKYDELSTKPGSEKELKALKFKLDKVAKLKAKLVAVGKKIASGEELPEKEKQAVQKAVLGIVKELKVILQSKEDTASLRAQIDKRVPLVELMKKDVDFLSPKDREADFTQMSEAELKNLQAAIEKNKESFQQFVEVMDLLPFDLSDEAVKNYFLAYLENGQKPPLLEIKSSLVELMEWMKTLEETQQKIFEKTLEVAETHKALGARKGVNVGDLQLPSLSDLSNSFNTEATSQFAADISQILAEIFNNPGKKIASHTLWIRTCIKSQERELAKLDRDLTLLGKQSQMIDNIEALASDKTEAQQKKLLQTQADYYKTFVANLQLEKTNLEAAFDDMERVTPDKRALDALRTEKVRLFEAIDKQIKMAQGVLNDLVFAGKMMADETSYREELVDPKKTLSRKSLEFAKKKAQFLAEKIKQLKFSKKGTDEEWEKAIREWRVLGDQLVTAGILQSGYENGFDLAKYERDFTQEEKDLYDRFKLISQYAHEMTADGARIESETLYLELEKTALEGGFTIYSALEVYKKLNNELSKDLADKCLALIEMYGGQELVANDKKAQAAGDLMNSFNLFFNEDVQAKFQSIQVEGMDDETLDGWKKTSEWLLSLYDESIFDDLQSSLVGIREKKQLLEGQGLESSPLYGRLVEYENYYQAVYDTFSTKTATGASVHKFLEHVAYNTTPDTFWQNFKDFWTDQFPVIAAAVAGAILLATPIGIGFAAVGAPGLVVFAASSAAAGVGMTLGTNTALVIKGVHVDWLNFGNDFLKNWGTSALAMAGGYGLGMALKLTPNLGWFGRSLLKVGGTFEMGLKSATGGLRQMLINNGVLRVASESAQEVLETGAEKVNPYLGFILSCIDTMDGMNVNTDAAVTAKVLAETAGVTMIHSGEIESVFEFDSGDSSRTALLARLSALDSSAEATFGKGIIKSGDNGEVLYTFKKDGEEMTWKFLPSKEAFGARAFFSSDMGVIFENKFQVAQNQGGGHYEFEGKPKALADSLRNGGFVARTTSEGFVVAQKGDLTLEFRPRPLPEFSTGQVVDFTYRGEPVRGFVVGSEGGKTTLALSQEAAAKAIAEPKLDQYFAERRSNRMPIDMNYARGIEATAKVEAGKLNLPATSPLGQIDNVVFTQKEMATAIAGPKSQRIAALESAGSTRLKLARSAGGSLSLGILGPSGLVARARNQLSQAKAWARGETSPLSLDQKTLSAFDSRLAAEVKTRLDKRGLPANALQGLTVDQQIRVLEDVDMQENAGRVTPEDVLEILHSPDGLGVYKVGLMLGKLDPLNLQAFASSMTLDQLTEVASVNQELGDVLIAQKLQAEPDFAKVALEDVVAAFGANAMAEIQGLAERFSRGDESALVEFEKRAGGSLGELKALGKAAGISSAAMVLSGCTGVQLVVGIGTPLLILISAAGFARQMGWLGGRKGWARQTYLVFEAFYTGRTVAGSAEAAIFADLAPDQAQFLRDVRTDLDIYLLGVGNIARPVNRNMAREIRGLMDDLDALRAATTRPRRRAIVDTMMARNLPALLRGAPAPAPGAAPAVPGAAPAPAPAPGRVRQWLGRHWIISSAGTFAGIAIAAALLTRACGDDEGDDEKKETPPEDQPGISGAKAEHKATAATREADKAKNDAERRAEAGTGDLNTAPVTVPDSEKIDLAIKAAGLAKEVVLTVYQFKTNRGRIKSLKEAEHSYKILQGVLQRRPILDKSKQPLAGDALVARVKEHINNIRNKIRGTKILK